jgi:hypothetical protein
MQKFVKQTFPLSFQNSACCLLNVDKPIVPIDKLVYLSAEFNASVVGEADVFSKEQAVDRIQVQRRKQELSLIRRVYVDSHLRRDASALQLLCLFPELNKHGPCAHSRIVYKPVIDN